MSYHRFSDVSSSSPEVEVSPSSCNTHLSEYERYSAAGSLAVQSDVFPDIGEEVLGDFLGAQAWSVDAFMECTSDTRSPVADHKAHEKKHDSSGAIEEKFMKKTAAPPSLSDVLTTYTTTAKGNLSESKNFSIPKLQCDDTILVDGVIPQTAIEDRQALLKRAADGHDNIEDVSAQQSNLSSGKAVDQTADIVDGSNSDNEFETGSEDITQKSKKDVCVPDWFKVFICVCFCREK